jgi:transketolase
MDRVFWIGVEDAMTTSQTARKAEDSSVLGETPSIDRLCIDTIRTLSMDAVQKANSGHPGTPMALAPPAYTLWRNVLRFDPEQPRWPNRDRFVLSNGHASMLLYSLLHLAGVKEADGELAVSLDDIKAFRQLDSKCPGHPEYGVTAGVETTTGPLGQGCGISVGMAMAAKWLAKTYNRPDLTLFDYDVYAFCSDGDMMEGVSNEAASLAGHLMLGNLCWIYDDNHITIEGHTDLSFSDDVAARFKSYGWNVERVGDANDTERFAQALKAFKDNPAVPTMIVLSSRIGYGAPHKEDTSAAHGEPLGEEEVRLAKRAYGWPEDAQFLVPDGVREHFQAGIGQRGAKAYADWSALMKRYAEANPKQAAELARIQNGEAPDKVCADLPVFPPDAKGSGTRESAGKALNAVAKAHPWMIGGAGDLAPSTKTLIEDVGNFAADKYGGRNLHFGIREHAMGAALNGLALSGLRPYGSTFLIFTDYMKPSIRLAALMELPVIYVMTHDSIGLGEDGPTHQSIEQLIGLRAIPHLITLRPADANEVVEAWRVIAGLTDRPALLALSRQAAPTLDRKVYASAKGVAQGAYVLADSGHGAPDVILMGTGTEVGVCVEAYEALKGEGVAARLVSMPSWELFEQQTQVYRDSVLPPAVTARVSVEAASTMGWDRYVGPQGAAIGMHGFGASAPAKDLMKRFGFTPQAVVAAAKQQMALAKKQARPNGR